MLELKSLFCHDPAVVNVAGVMTHAQRKINNGKYSARSDGSTMRKHPVSWAETVWLLAVLAAWLLVLTQGIKKSDS